MATDPAQVPDKKAGIPAPISIMRTIIGIAVTGGLIGIVVGAYLILHMSKH